LLITCVFLFSGPEEGDGVFLLGLHGITSQKMAFLIVTGVTTQFYVQEVEGV
jgi:hypothetical protein